MLQAGPFISNGLCWHLFCFAVHVLPYSEELKRCGLSWPAPDTRCLDVCLLFPDYATKFRTLVSAVTEYLHRRHDGAHDALQDVLATVDLLQQLVRWHGNCAVVTGGHSQQFSPRQFCCGAVMPW